MAKFSDGEDVFASLEAVARTHQIESGAILWGIGMLQDFEIGFFGPQGYEKKTYAGRHELLAFHGSITMRADPKFHVHVGVAGPDHGVVGGHLFRARSCIVNEICIERFGRIRLNRKRNPKTTLNELEIE
ncbi:MAG TPA: PPC domain-containing DNA-binding protein [Thermoplasmata archaeon]|nr:PPC domain-containing DNA-binding protein [Thermoplasmata archaeon]